MDPKLEVQNKVLEYGGATVLINNNDFIVPIKEKGKLFDPIDVVTVGGYDYDSNFNSYDFCCNNSNMRLCTGLSYNKDNELWSWHSWCVDENNKIYECTPIIREGYYGAVLNEMELELFSSKLSEKNSIKKHL